MLRGAEGFGLRQHVRTDRLLTLSEDLSLVTVAVDAHPRVEAALEAELRLNRRTAPMLYRRLLPVTKTEAGEIAVDGKGTAIEWLLEMRRFPDGARLDRVAAQGPLPDALVADLGGRILVRGALDGKVQQRDQAFRAFEAEAFAADVLGLQKFLEGHGVIELAEDADFFRTRELGAVARTLNALGDPAGDLHVVDEPAGERVRRAVHGVGPGGPCGRVGRWPGHDDG